MTSGVIGSFVGAIAGFMGKWVDSILMRLVDVTLAFPPILLAMVIAARFPAANTRPLTMTQPPQDTHHARAQGAGQNYPGALCP